MINKLVEIFTAQNKMDTSSLNLVENDMVDVYKATIKARLEVIKFVSKKDEDDLIDLIGFYSSLASMKNREVVRLEKAEKFHNTKGYIKNSQYLVYKDAWLILSGIQK